MLAFTVYSNDLKETLMKNFNQENSEMIDEVEIETEHKMSGKYGGTLKVMMSHFLIRASIREYIRNLHPVQEVTYFVCHYRER